MTTYGSAPTALSSDEVAPDPRVIKALGGHHTLPSALADLVDNSIDAGACNVLIRFLIRDDKPVGLIVLDDGRGMSDRQLGQAMVYGGRRDYDVGDLGHYGVGMKAASLSQAEEMHVFSRRSGYTAAGRGLDRNDIGTNGAPRVVTFDPKDAETRLDDVRAEFSVQTGTLVQWLRPVGFSRSDDPSESREWLSRTHREIDTELGLIFHRKLGSGNVRIIRDEFNLDFGEAGLSTELEPLDPFAPVLRDPGVYSEDLCSAVESFPFCVSAVVWPHSKASLEEFNLGTRDGFERQGFYIYRNDRLLQAGGWNGLFERTQDRKFARVAVELVHDLEPHVRMNSEKQGIVFSQAFENALRNSRSPDSGESFADFLQKAAGTATDSRRRQRRTERLVEPLGGIIREIYDAMDENFGFDPGQPGMDVRWDLLTPEQVFNIDMDGRTLRLNLRYRRALTGRDGTVSPANSPMITTLLYLFARNEFKRINEGNLWLETQQKWQNILLAAVKAQEKSDGLDS